MADNHQRASQQPTPGPGATVTRGTTGQETDQDIRRAATRAEAAEAEILPGLPPPARLTGGEVRPGRQ